METTTATKPILSHLYQLCYDAHRNTSFSTEKRAEQYVNSFSKVLEEDLKLLGDKAGNYKEKFIEKFSGWMSAKGRCISSMITGGSNFPVRRAQKANASEHNHYTNFQSWREKYFTAVNRVPTKSPEEDRDLAIKKVEALANIQLEMKEINAEIRKCKLTNLTALVNHLVGMEYDSNLVSCIDFRGGKYKIPSYQLTNNNARLKKAKEKIQIMETRIDRKNTWEDIQFEGGYVTIEDDRVKIYHDEKPAREIIQEIKSNGFRWSPHWGCWCRKHTGNAIYSLRFLSFLKKD